MAAINIMDKEFQEHQAMLERIERLSKPYGDFERAMQDYAEPVLCMQWFHERLGELAESRNEAINSQLRKFDIDFDSSGETGARNFTPHFEVTPIREAIAEAIKDVAGDLLMNPMADENIEQCGVIRSIQALKGLVAKIAQLDKSLMLLDVGKLGKIASGLPEKEQADHDAEQSAVTLNALLDNEWESVLAALPDDSDIRSKDLWYRATIDEPNMRSRIVAARHLHDRLSRDLATATTKITTNVLRASLNSDVRRSEKRITSAESSNRISAECANKMVAIALRKSKDATSRTIAESIGCSDGLVRGTFAWKIHRMSRNKGEIGKLAAKVDLEFAINYASQKKWKAERFDRENAKEFLTAVLSDQELGGLISEHTADFEAEEQGRVHPSTSNYHPSGIR